MYICGVPSLREVRRLSQEHPEGRSCDSPDLREVENLTREHFEEGLLVRPDLREVVASPRSTPKGGSEIPMHNRASSKDQQLAHTVKKSDNFYQRNFIKITTELITRVA